MSSKRLTISETSGECDQEILDLFVRLVSPGDIPLEHIRREFRSTTGEEHVEVVDERGLTETFHGHIASMHSLGHVLQDLLPLESELELDLPELHRLEAGGGVETIAERDEGFRRHRLEDVDLADDRLENHPDSLEQVVDPRGPPRGI